MRSVTKGSHLVQALSNGTFAHLPIFFCCPPVPPVPTLQDTETESICGVTEATTLSLSFSVCLKVTANIFFCIRACPSVHPDLAATMGSVWSFGEHCKNGLIYVFLLDRVHGTMLIQKNQVHQTIFTVGSHN